MGGLIQSLFIMLSVKKKIYLLMSLTVLNQTFHFPRELFRKVGEIRGKEMKKVHVDKSFDCII